MSKDDDEMKLLISCHSLVLGNHRSIHLAMQGLARFPHESKLNKLVLVGGIGSCSQEDARNLSHHLALSTCSIQDLGLKGSLGIAEFTDLIAQGIKANTSLQRVWVVPPQELRDYRGENQAMLVEAISRSKLRSIRLHHCRGLGGGGGGTSLKSLSKSAVAIKELDLVDCDLKGANATALVQVIATTMTSLEILRLSSNDELGDQGVVAVADALLAQQHLVLLRELYLVHVGSGDRGARALAQMLATNQSLVRLDFGCNDRVGVEGYVALVQDGLVYNTRLLNAQLPWPEEAGIGLPTAQLEAMYMTQGILAMNNAGRRYLQTEPDNRLAGVRVLESVIDDSLECVYLHLRENPRIMTTG